jgi:hypothetical protein
MRRLTHLGVVLCGLAVVSSIRADVTPTDLQVAARALSFMERPLSGTVRIGIVHSAASPRSVRQAEDLRAMLAGGLRAGALDLRPVLVEIGQAGSANVDLFFLTEFVSPHERSLATISAARQIPCITTDVGQVRSGACTMGVRSKPKVEIFVNRAAALDSGMTFATVFRVMITEI